jgi:hypothetical protein
VRKRAAERTSRDDVSTEQADAHTDQGCGLEGVACTLCGDSEDPAKAGAKESGPGFLIVEEHKINGSIRTSQNPKPWRQTEPEESDDGMEHVDQ